MSLVKDVQTKQQQLEDNLQAKVKEAALLTRKLDSAVNKSISDTYWPLLFTALASLMIGSYAVDRGYIYELDSPNVQTIKDTEQHITKVSGTQFRMSCADLLKDTKEGISKVNWRLDNQAILNQYEDSEHFTSRVIMPAGSKLEKRADISKAGVLSINTVRTEDEGVYSCEIISTTLLGYESVDHRRWYKLSVVTMARERMIAMVAVVSSLVFGGITLTLSLVENLYDDIVRAYQARGQAGKQDGVEVAAEIPVDVATSNESVPVKRKASKARAKKSVSATSKRSKSTRRASKRA